MNNFLFETVFGMYSPADQKIFLDYGNGLFGNNFKSTIFHEQTHFILHTETNYGLFTGLFLYLTKEKKFIKLNEAGIKFLANELYKSQEYVQEGFATLFTLVVVQKEKGKEAAKEKLRLMDNKPYGESFATIEFLLDWSQEERDKFTQKTSACAMNTNIHLEFNKSQLFSDHKFIKEYFTHGNNNPFKRLQKLASAIYKNKKLLDCSEEEICKAAGISFLPFMNLKERSNMVNTMLELTSIRERFTEKTVFDPDRPDKTRQFLETVTIMNINSNIRNADALFNIDNLGKLGLPTPDLAFIHYKHNILKDEPLFYEKTKDKDTTVIFFYKNRKPLLVLFTEKEMEIFFKDRNDLTVVTDKNMFNNLTIKDDYNFLKPNFVILRNYLDIKEFLDLLWKYKRKFKHVSFAPTKKHLYITNLFRVENDEDIYIFTGLPVHLSWMKQSDNYKNKMKTHGGFTKLIGTNNKHFSSVMRFLYNTPPEVDYYEFVKNAAAYYPILHRKLTGKDFTGTL